MGFFDNVNANIKDKVREAVISVLNDNVYVSDISDSGYVDYILDTESFSDYKWQDAAYKYKSEMIEKIADEVIKELYN